MTRQRYVLPARIFRLLITLTVLLGASWLAPLPPAAQAAPAAAAAPAVAAAQTTLATARPAQDPPPLPDPLPTLVVQTATIADSAVDTKCDLWEAMQAVINAELGISNGVYHECQAQVGQPNVIGFSGALQGGTIVVPDSINGGQLPYSWGNETILGPITLKAESTDTHLIHSGPEANLTFISVTFSGAHTSGGGAAILDENFATINLYGCIFTSNTADENGGAISSDGSLNIVQTSFTNNQAMGVSTNTGNGGAIALYGVGTLNISLSKFTNNSSHAGGGALYVLTPNASIVDTQFLGNQGGVNETIPQGGGALFNDTNGALSIARTVFDGNQSPQGSGGAIYNNAGASLTISDTSFTTNQAGDASHAMSGGAVFNSGVLTVTRSSFSQNISAIGDGGGLVDDLSGDAIVANSTFVANTAPSGHGAALVVAQTNVGGAVSHLLLLNDTIAGNGSVSDAGVWASPGQDLTLGNTLLVNNPTGNCAGDDPTSEGHNLDSGSTCHLTGNGDLSGNSHANLDAPGYNGGAIPTLLTMPPLPSSSAVDSGDGALCGAEPVEKLDERGSPRPIGGAAPGEQNPGCDIGAFEADAPSPRFGSTPSSPGPLNVGHVQVHVAASTVLQISNSGDYRLDISNIALAGPDAGDFGLVSAAPFSIDPGAPPHNLTINCTPNAAALRTATLTLDSNDAPDHASVSYSLVCTGDPQAVSGFNPSPSPASPISFPGTEFGATASFPIAIANNGNAILNVTLGALAGANAADFQVVGGNFSVNPGASHTLTVQCTPNDYGLLTATLTLTTNDSTHQTIVYNLSCVGKPAPSPYLLPAGSAVTNSPTDHGLLNAFGVAISPDGQHLYATSYGGGTVSSFRRDPASGALTYQGKNDFTFITDFTAGARQLAVSPDNGDVAIAGETHNAVVIGIPDASSGANNGWLDNFLHANTRPAGDHSLDGAFGVTFSPDGRFIYATGHTGNGVVVFQHDAPNHGLNFVQAFTSTSVLAGPYGLAVSPDGRNVYVAGSTNGSVEVFSRNPATGKLSPLQYRHEGDTIDTAALTGMNGAWEVAVSPDGANVYLTARFDGDVVAFSRSAGDGSLTWIGTLTCGCSAPADLGNASGLDVTPDGQQVIVAGNAANAAVVLDRDPLTGLLSFHETDTQASLSLPMAGPADLRISPDGRFAYIAAYNSSALVTLPVGNPQPILTHFSPASAVQHGPAFTLHVYGANFLPSTVVYFGAHTPPVSYVSPYELDIPVDSAFIGTAGPVDIQLKTPQPGGNDAFSFIKEFTVSSAAVPQNPVPSIDHITPQGQPSGSGGVTLDVYGTNFINGSTIRWNGAARATTFIDAGHLQTTLPQSLVSQPGISSVSVSTGAPGGGVSNAVSFSVAPPGQNAVATLNSLSPATTFSHGAGSKDLLVTLVGQHFILGAVGQINGANRPTQFVDSTHLKVTLFGSDLSAATSTAVTVFTPAPGGGVSNPLTFIVRRLFVLFVPVARR